MNRVFGVIWLILLTALFTYATYRDANMGLFPIWTLPLFGMFWGFVVTKVVTHK